MKQKKIVFIDVDGTLVGDDQTLLPSTIKAIELAKKNGHLLFLCTGRSKPELHDYILELGFNGTICANGGSVEFNDDVSKICFLGSDYPFAKVEERYCDYFNVMSCTVPMFGKESGELAVKGVSKSSAIQFLLEHLNIDKNETIAIGDGMNDMDMLEYCSVGIAMGNADERLKAIADYTTSDVEEDGLYKAFEKYQLI